MKYGRGSSDYGFPLGGRGFFGRQPLGQLPTSFKVDSENPPEHIPYTPPGNALRAGYTTTVERDPYGAPGDFKDYTDDPNDD